MTKRKLTRKHVPSLVRQSVKRRPRQPLIRGGSRFAQVQLESDEHPVDVSIDRNREVAALQRKLLQLAVAIQGQVRDQKAFVAYEDLRLEHRIRREQLYFDAGWRYGELAGRAESTGARAGASEEGRVFARQILAAVTTANLPDRRATALLLDAARALVLSPRMARRVLRWPRDRNLP